MTDLQRELVTMRIEMLNAEILDVWSEETDMAIIPVLNLLDERTNNIEIRMGVMNHMGVTTLPL